RFPWMRISISEHGFQSIYTRTRSFGTVLFWLCFGAYNGSVARRTSPRDVDFVGSSKKDTGPPLSHDDQLPKSGPCILNRGGEAKHFFRVSKNEAGRRSR